MSIVWVRPDVPGIERVFCYELPETISGPVPIGTVVRVPLQGRRVRGWVVPSDGPPPAGALRAVIEVVSAGPPPDVVALADWAAWRYAGNPVALLRVASPQNRVRDIAAPVVPAPDRKGFAVEVVAIAPTADRRAFLRDVVASSGSTIIVMPPGTRTATLVETFRREGRTAVALTGAQSDAERTASWRRAREGSCIVVGGRVAVWAPVPDLTRIVVLDEGDEALVEERTPTWNARDVAIERARRSDIPIALVSPAPSLEARVRSEAVTRPERSVEREYWPVVEVVDRRDEEHRVGILSVPFAAAAHRALDAGQRVLAVINRKGRVRLYACAACHELARCETCGAAVNEGGDGLECPRCSTTRPKVCAKCFATKLKVLRVGVTRLADDLRALLPNATVLDVDATTTDVGPADVYVGTEAVLHRVPRDRRVGLVAFLDFDQELTAPRIRAAEEAEWLLIRAARLVGARARNGRILVQTAVPEHPVIVAASAADPLLVADYERPMRAALGFPPFGGLASLRGDAAAIDALCAAVRAAGATVIGPTAHGDGLTALVRATSSDALADILAATLPGARDLGRVRVDVDPVRA